MTKEDWENLSDEEQQDIYRKCKESPAYFYNNFIRKEGQRKVSDEEFVAMRRAVMLKPRQRYKDIRPLLPEKCFKP